MWFIFRKEVWSGFSISKVALADDIAFRKAVNRILVAYVEMGTNLRTFPMATMYKRAGELILGIDQAICVPSKFCKL